MKHKHYDMIVAKAANMDLVVFYHTPATNEWRTQLCQDDMDFEEGVEYFLCLPQHKEPCLHWLNGGKYQLEYTHQSYPTWNDIDNDAADWSEGHVFMDVRLKIRIKPSKEKRWVIAMKSNDSVELCGKQLHTSRESAVEFAELHGESSHLQFIEIEVEV